MSNTPQNPADLTLTTLSGHEDTIWGLAYLPGGKRVVTCSDDTTVRIWDVETGEQQGRSMEHEGGVYGLAVTRDGKRILSGGDDKSITVWDVETQEAIEEWGTHTSSIWCIAMSDSVDQLAASGDAYGKIVIKEMKEGGQIKQSIDAGNSVRSLCFSPNGEKLACAANEMDDGVHVVHVYDVESGELVLGPINHGKVVRCVLWSLDGSKLFSASDDRTIQCWDSKTGESIGQPWRGHDNYVTSLSVSPDGTKLASASADKTIRFWDARSGDPIERPLQHKSRVWAVTFSPASRSGEFVASGGSDKKVTIWHVPWWNEPQAHDPFINLPVPRGLPANDRHQGELDLDLPINRPPITSSSQPPGRPVGFTAVPIITRIQRFWRRLLVRRSSQSVVQEAIDPRRMSSTAEAGLSSHAEPSRSNWNTGASTHQAAESQNATHPLHYHGPKRDEGEDSRPSVLVAGDVDVDTNARSTVETPTAFKQPIVGTAWNLDDARSNFAHDITDYVVREGEEPFASGSFGDIYRGKLRLSGRSIDVAVKAIRTYSGDDDDDHAQRNKRSRRELQTWVNLEHMNVLPLLGTTMNFGRLPAMVCPWLENGSLTFYLERRNDTLTIIERLSLLSDAAAGLQYLHSQSIVHGDLSGSNVLIDGNGRACISDFGLSMLLTKLGGSTYATSRRAEGTLRWTAPELLDLEVPEDEEIPLHVIPTPQSDVYSFGRIMLQVLTGRVPYHYYVRDSQVLSAISKGNIPQRPGRALVTDRQWSFMQQCWMSIGMSEPRPSGDEIVEFVRQELTELENATS